MQLIILSIHLVVCVCLIGLVLLQRSEGGALGMGGGGGGSLMSGRGASDALANMTSIAGGLFLAVSLLLTWLSGAGQGEPRGVIDFSRPAIERPVTAPAPAPEQVPPATPDPTQSSAPQASENALASILPGPGEASAATPSQTNPGAARAAPIDGRPASVQVAATPARTSPAASAPVAQQTASNPPRREATTQPASTGASRPTPQPLAPEVTDSGVSGVTLTEPSTPESVSVGQAVRRERAGPDQ